MGQDVWSSVDGYFTELLVPADPALDSALGASVTAGLPAISVTPTQGRLLQLLARMSGARNALEIGTLGGYSTIWLARGLPDDGRVVTLEIDPVHADVARANFARADLHDRIELLVGPALDTLPRLAAEGRGPFDFVFIDADKPSNPDYFAWALRLSRPGTVIVVDNVVRGGRVIEPASEDGGVLGARAVTELIATEPRVTATAIQTVGDKGHDGFILARVD